MPETRATTQVRPTDQLDPTVRERLPQDLAEAVDFHGHLCPGLTIGYRAARIAMERLGAERGSDEQLVGIVETDACGVDAFQLLTGCTLGKGNLIFKDYGKQAFTLARRADRSGVRVVVRPDVLSADPECSQLRARVMSGEASEDERARFSEQHVYTALSMLTKPAASFGMVSDLTIDLPSTARLFDSVVCSVCGEAVMEPRSRLVGGQPCCIPCSTRYGRGWEINE